MVGFLSGGTDDDLFDEPDAFVPEHLPEPGAFLNGQDVLTGEDHVDIHRIATEVFEARGVYDVTFGYNLAKLSLDSRHPDAGFRFAEEADDPSVLRAEFTPTTAFCPQGDTLARGSFRALNGLAECHAYDLVRVRVAESHQQSETINEELAELAATFRETGELPAESEATDKHGDTQGPGMAPGGGAGPVAGRSDEDTGSTDAPF